MSQLLTINQVAERLQVSTRTIHRWITASSIPVTYIGKAIRFDEKKIERWIESQTIKTKS